MRLWIEIFTALEWSQSRTATCQILNVQWPNCQSEIKLNWSYYSYCLLYSSCHTNSTFASGNNNTDVHTDDLYWCCQLLKTPVANATQAFNVFINLCCPPVVTVTLLVVTVHHSYVMINMIFLKKILFTSFLIAAVWSL